MSVTLPICDLDRSRLEVIYSSLQDENVNALTQALGAFFREVDVFDVKRAAQICVADWRGHVQDGNPDLETVKKDIMWHIIGGLLMRLKVEQALTGSVIAQRFLGRKAAAKQAIQCVIKGDNAFTWGTELATLIVGWQPAK